MIIQLVLLYLTVFLKEIVSFESQVLRSTPKVEDFVWFDEPEKFNHRFYSKQLQVSQSLQNTSNDDQSLGEMVWFDYNEPKNTFKEVSQIKGLDELEKSAEGTSDTWRLEDQIFAKHFFSNKWE